MNVLFSPLDLREVTLKNRLVVSPMCQYSSVEGFANDWHLVHLGSRAVGGAALVFTEAAAVTPEGRISPADLGIWSDEHVPFLSRITEFVQEQGAHAGVQLAHAGRKASTAAPWLGGGPLPEEDAWPTIAPSPVPFNDTYPVPEMLSEEAIAALVADFGQAARRALEAGFEVIELHAAHGYLLHEFLSPLTNLRADRYGGSLENRTRLLREVVVEIRRHWPENLPLFVRLSATDWMPGGWDLASSVALAQQLKPLGVDLIDCSSGGLVPNARIPAGPGYQVEFAARIRQEADLLTGAVGFITEPAQAETIVRTGQADVVLLARELLRQPYWPLHAAHALHQDLEWLPQYERAKPHG